MRISLPGAAASLRTATVCALAVSSLVAGAAFLPDTASLPGRTAIGSAAAPVAGSHHASSPGQSRDAVAVVARRNDAEPAPRRSPVGSAPDDPRFPDQQSYLRAIAAPGAWAQRHGSRSVRIAVLDTGIDVTHPDLRGKIVGTYNAVNGSSSIVDRDGHGTFVAGIAAAATDNRIGVAGVGYNSAILGVKIAGPGGSISVAAEVRGIHWAISHGADIINLSIGGPGWDQAEAAAVADAEHHGVLVVAAAGNDGTTTREYPAAYPGVIAVGATDTAHHRRAGFSTHGSWVTLAAPGVDIYSTTPRARSQFAPAGQDYATGNGTSFATPLVAGAAALIEGAVGHLSAAQLRAALVDSAHGYQHEGLGAGQLDIVRALNHARRIAARQR